MIYVLLGYILASECMHRWERTRLINKIMSRNYHDYEFTKNLPAASTGEVKLREDPEHPEDLAPVHGFGMN